MKEKVGKIVDYMYSETPKRGHSKNKVVPIPQLKHNQNSSLDDAVSERKFSSSGSDNYKTTYDRSRSRTKSAIRPTP
jgi:hypothetical protein